MNKTKIFKRSLALVIVGVSLLGLASCKKVKDQIPYGSLTDSVYAEGTGFKITEKELYEEMRINGVDLLNKEFENIVFKEEIKKVNDNFEDYKEDLIKYANQAIFGTSKLDDLKEYKEKDLVSAVESYLDSMFLKGTPLTTADIDADNFEAHSDELLKQYVNNVAKKLYAKEKLAEEVVDEDSNYYIDKDKDIESYFKSNIQKRYPLSFVSIRFSNSYEANETLRYFNIKTYRQNWYIIPDPRDVVVDGYALSVLEDLGLEDSNGSLSELDHQKYFDKYSVNPEREISEGEKDELLDENEVLFQILEIYNYIYPYKAIDLSGLDKVEALEQVLADEDFVNDDEDAKGLFTLTYEDFPINSQSESTLNGVRTYLYNTLSTKENGTRFTASPRSFGNYYYLLYKLEDHNDDILNQVDEEDKLIVWADEDKKELKDYALTYYEELVENKLTESYVNSKASARYNDVKVVIYDSDVHLFLRNDKYELAKKFDNNLVATVDGEEITVDQFYALLKKQYGPSIAMDMGIKKTLLNSKYVDQITKKQRQEYEENIDNLISQFSSDAFASSGFPASIGRAKFLKLAFQSNSKEEAVERVYILSEVEKLYLADYKEHFGEQVYDKFLTLANRLQEQTFSLTTGHLIVKVDMDEDENPDDPQEFFDTLTAAEVLEYKEAITELLALIYTKASKYPNFDSGLQDIVKLYKESARFNCDDNYVGDDDDDEQNKLCGPEKDWAKFKKLGLQIEYQSLGTQTNKTNWPGQQNFDEKFYDRIVEFYDFIYEEYYELDEKFPKQLLDSKPIVYDDVLETSFGWHLILALGGDVAKSAKFTYSDDKYIDGDNTKGKIYEKVELKDKDGNVEKTLNAYSDDKKISLNQVEIYLHQKDSDYDIDLPSNVNTAITNYLAPIVARYEEQEMRLHLLHKLVTGANLTFTNASDQTTLDGILAINQKQFLKYATLESNKEYFEIFGDWFTIFN